MALKSKWFGDNQRCQECSRVDAKHILTSDSGLHVFLVQEALILIDGARIDTAELDQWRYGPSTAAAVLRYKQARDIVNRSYQQKADDIVGKMTIASLDDSMYVLESGIVLLGGAALQLGRILLASPKLQLSRNPGRSGPISLSPPIQHGTPKCPFPTAPHRPPLPRPLSAPLGWRVRAER